MKIVNNLKKNFLWNSRDTERIKMDKNGQRRIYGLIYRLKPTVKKKSLKVHSFKLVSPLFNLDACTSCTKNLNIGL